MLTRTNRSLLCSRALVVLFFNPFDCDRSRCRELSRWAERQTSKRKGITLREAEPWLQMLLLLFQVQGRTQDAERLHHCSCPVLFPAGAAAAAPSPGWPPVPPPAPPPLASFPAPEPPAVRAPRQSLPAGEATRKDWQGKWPILGLRSCPAPAEPGPQPRRRAAGGRGGGGRRSPQHPRPRRRPAEVTCGRGGPPAPAPLRPGAGGLEVPSGSLEGLPLRHSLLPRAVSEKQMLQQSVGFRGASTSRLQPAYFCHKLSLRNPSDLSSSWKSITANHAATALLPWFQYGP